jgi:site-specific recombinase XerD
MTRTASSELFALVESFFIEYLPRQRGASSHTIRAYRDTLKLLFEFIAQRLDGDLSALVLEALDANAIATFLDHIEARRSNSASTRNCRRAAIRSFFKHLLRNDLARSMQYSRVLAIPSKKARQRPIDLSRSRRCARDHRQAGSANPRRMAQLHAAVIPLQLRRSGSRGHGRTMG